MSTDGRIAEINPENGTLLKETQSGKDMRLSPIVAGQMLYILAEDGTLIAYR
jgi:outer membrane protein assembly factor BamB